MPRVALLNMVIGFTVLFFAAAAGSVIGFNITDAYLFNRDYLDTWQLLMQRSAHGHTNLFGMLHIILGLTMPYAGWSPRIRAMQTAGLASGVIAMGPVMALRSFAGPSDKLDFWTILMGVLLTFALLSIGTQAAGLLNRFVRPAR